MKEDDYEVNYIDPSKADEIVVINPNQIKSATDNEGTFSTENDDIRFNKDQDGLFDILDFMSKIKITIGESKREFISKFKGEYYIPKNISVDEIEKYRIANLLPQGIFNITENKNSTTIAINESALVDAIERND